MELIKLAARRSRWSDVTYILLNIAYALALFVFVTPGVDLPYLAYALVLLSKWRVVAVRPRFWFANIQANFVDFMVGISVVTLMWLTAGATIWVAFALAVLFSAWLVILKPHSDQKWVLMQAGIAQFISLIALFSVAHNFEIRPIITDSSFLTVVVAWIIGYISARHALSAFRGEDERAFLSLLWAFLLAELAWLAHHWTIAYSIYRPIGSMTDHQLMIPQVAIIAALIGFIAIRWYRVFHAPSDKYALKSARNATIFSLCVIAIVLFNGTLLLDVTAL
ncbi:hypothetical protein E6P97_00685 [Patescibacteria group bacterium]|nr:MAG: hypothetical protein E6P97_00685 [Patescibacteria group bacterium]